MRAAVLKLKDPRQIIRDMEKLDEMGEMTGQSLCNLDVRDIFSCNYLVVCLPLVEDLSLWNTCISRLMLYIISVCI